MTRCPRCRRRPHRHDRCRVCRARERDLELLRSTLAALRSDLDAAVLEAAERYERAEAAFDALRQGDSAEELFLEQEAADAALLAAVRARSGSR